MRLRATSLLTSAGLGLLALAGSALGGPHPLLVYNPTPSAPLGFYTVSPPRDLHVGDMVIVALSAAYRQLVTERRYIGAGVPLIKRIVALAGDLVCEHEGAVAVNGRLLAQALAADGRGRPMPVWEGCRPPSTAGISGRFRRRSSSGKRGRCGRSDLRHGLLAPLRFAISAQRGLASELRSAGDLF